MNRRNVAALLAVLGLLALSAGMVRAGDEATANLDVKLSVRGMTCASCVDKVKAALQAIPGVTKAEVNLEKNEASVTYAKGKTTPDDLVKAVEKAGYKCSLQKDETKKG
jgi:mercuric transport protein